MGKPSWAPLTPRMKPRSQICCCCSFYPLAFSSRSDLDLTAVMKLVRVLRIVFVVGMSWLGLAAPAVTQTTASAGAAVSTVGPPARVVFVQQPSDSMTQMVMAPAIRVGIADANGNLVTTATNRVRVNLSGVYGLGGTLVLNAHKG